MLSLPHTFLLLAFSALGASAASSSHSATKSSASGVPSSSNRIGTPSNSAALPSLSAVSPCVNNCLAVAAGADGCQSLAAVDCFCPNPANYTSAFLGCLTGCPSEVASAEALVQKFCAAAATPTSLSFASFTPSSSASAASSSFISGSSVTAPPSSSVPTTSASSSANAALALVREGAPLLLPLGVGVAGMFLGRRPRIQGEEDGRSA
ncbi:hypothetical protein B0H13DRAFT_2425729 [Mycena leptocephala]|nr:hypothetical protein B0H13DRAFT_2425729 [Mycena leptocephala]